MRVVPAAAPAMLRDLLLGPPQPARVVAAFPQVSYLEPVDAPASVVAVSTRAATLLPITLVLVADEDGGGVPPVEAGAAATVGGGGLSVGPLYVHAARWWRPPPPARVCAGALLGGVDCLERLLDSVPPPAPVLSSRLAALRGACAAYDGAAAGLAGRRLVGLGPGLTPAGDDVLAGLLVALHRLPTEGRFHRELTDLRAPLAAVAVEAAGHTTSLSATLLGCAARGAAAGPVLEVADALAGRGGVEPAARRLLAVGHSSGRDLATGLLLGARTVCRVTGQGRVAS